VVDDTLLEAIEEVAAASSTFLTGDPEPFKALWSHADDVTIFGGYGRSRRGWAEVARRLDWASARFRAGSVTYESLAADSSGDLGYALGIERGRVTVVGHDEAGDIALRVTHLFRREGGRWRVIHRHADHSVDDLLAPEDVLVDVATPR
jgi:ketosteroid isomerase-like protein